MKIRNITFTTIRLMIACFALSQRLQAVLPAPDGGYPGGNTAEGQAALFSLTTGGFNTANGFLALRSNTIGQFNTATGAGALLLNTADENTATGAGALLSNTTGLQNTATGAFALFSNTEGVANTANGYQALFSNTTGVSNTAHGIQALFSNTIGNGNTADGNTALYGNTDGNGNTANGNSALTHNITGSFNTANGVNALFNNTTGSNNTASGLNALLHNTIGVENTATGDSALFSNTQGIRNTADGVGALDQNTTGSDNTAIGYFAGADITGSANVCIGAFVPGHYGVNSTTWIQNVYASVANARQVYVNADNKIGTLASSRRYKNEIRPMAKASEAIFSLRPVSFRYKKEVDPTSLLSFGLIAEEVAEVDPDLVTPDRDGKPETVRYEAVNAMLLNEFLKEHRKVEAQQSKIDKQEATMTEVRSIIAQQQEGMEALAMRLEEQASQIQKVSAQIGVSKPATQTVVNNR